MNKIFGLLKKRIKITKSGTLLYKHYKRVHFGSQKNIKKYNKRILFNNCFKSCPKSHQKRVKSYLV